MQNREIVLTETDTIKKEDRESTKILKQGFIDNYFKLTGNIAELCRQIKISRQTFYDWMDKDENFKEAIEAEQEGLIDLVESKLFQNIQSRRETSIIFFLKTRAKSRGYIERTEHELAGVLQHKVFLSITDFKGSLKEYNKG